ncbi:zinc finger HIT domain-containing protein 2 [Neocloeon triangulifer]|uniref:zinc finger HIT domain-containing protein 2 n=1 Tax=Neocloeon triangulifer TaxID=2078957 RepID=UPI00286F005F|nr:zinc finger HIT domain-containing protein 2 [Neocloeon triangulifer]
MDTDKNLCTLCGSVPGKYVCPRCNAFYCSLDCYRSEKHAQCSEQFYKECIQEEMAVDADPADAKSMQEILCRLQEHESRGIETGLLAKDKEEDESEADSDDLQSEPDDLASRLAGIDLNDPDSIWQKLSEEEKAEFQNLVSSGDATKIVPTWDPWWNYKAALVQEVESSDKFKKHCPRINQKIPALKDVSKVNPAVAFGIANVIYSYATITRYFQGDHLESDLVKEAADHLMDLSASLSKGENFVDQENAITSAKIQSIEILGSTQDDESLVLDDVQKIMEGPSSEEQSFYLLAALSDCLSLLKSASCKEKGDSLAAAGEFSKRFPDSKVREAKWSKKQLILAIKKLEFYISWAKTKSGQH